MRLFIHFIIFESSGKNSLGQAIAMSKSEEAISENTRVGTSHIIYHSGYWTRGINTEIFFASQLVEDPVQPDFYRQEHLKRAQDLPLNISPIQYLT